MQVNSSQVNKVQRMYLRWSLCTLYLLACQAWVTVGDMGLCCYLCDVLWVIIHPCSLILHRRSGPRSKSDSAVQNSAYFHGESKSKGTGRILQQHCVWDPFHKTGRKCLVSSIWKKQTWRTGHTRCILVGSMFTERDRIHRYPLFSAHDTPLPPPPHAELWWASEKHLGFPKCLYHSWSIRGFMAAAALQRQQISRVLFILTRHHLSNELRCASQ